MTAYQSTSQDLPWRTSSYSSTGGGQCVEVAPTATAVAVRDSRRPQDVVLQFSNTEWSDFLSGVVHGDV
ncbi:DUF397 domain-containing protein [Lipingzhangella sp. LS1_29]|uniref:DUF397 domain-containing protein n=1 Tax=Lipingzhangella rawalii TaxID=2055835 RepID=A0ABU2H9Q8_9ACTN|nr:DUF397 domain-containing protein [Lipingzhangella rawalii]MDS1272054.1 DUF397 domain-containing protein [Lipingzhangella rawalii]